MRIRCRRGQGADPAWNSLIRQITFPYSQIDHFVAPEGNGTRLELTYISSTAALLDRCEVASNMRAIANKYKEQIEESTV